ncbi:MAG: SpoIIE family protein phosphatase [Spirochaetes bacterium]|nr:SpoIIE family protein phosphatase [Spirochaetota bacterium]
MKHAPFLGMVLAVLVAAAGVSCADSPERQAPPRAEKGVLDLRKWDFERDGPLPLKGEWDFYWQRLLEPEDFRSSPAPLPSGSFNVPDSWNHYIINGKHLPGHGCATYRLRVTTNYPGALSLGTLHPNTAFRLWVNGRLLGRAGRVSADPALASPGQISRTVDMPTREDAEIIIQVSNHSYTYGGIWSSLSIGRKDDIRRRHENALAYDMFLFGSLFIMGLYYLGLFAVRKKDRSSLWFGLFSLLLALRTLVTNKMYILNIAPGIDWEVMVKLNFLTMTLSVPLFLAFIARLYGSFMFKTMSRVFIVLFGVFSLLIVLFPARIYSEMILFINGCLVLAGVYILVCLARAIRAGSEGAMIAFAGFVVIFIAAINDIFLANYLILSVQLVPMSIFIFIFAQSFNLARTFSSAFNKVEDLSENLEKKVRERTDELEVEKDHLRERNEIIENELNLARKIQQQLIPLHHPADFIHSLYRPMDRVGGDFYDFIAFEGSRRIGIFLSDVSGHGVPAAFITSMVKTIILQSGERKGDPARLLLYLNELLCGQTAGHFITAFYCVFDPESREVRYANAGHSHPYVIGHGVAELKGSRGLPLAVMPNVELERYAKTYRNNETVLIAGSKLLLFTDGLIEASAGDDRNNRFEERLPGLLARVGERDCRECVDMLFRELTEFRGTDRFDDDVCIICVDA